MLINSEIIVAAAPINGINGEMASPTLAAAVSASFTKIKF